MGVTRSDTRALRPILVANKMYISRSLMMTDGKDVTPPVVIFLLLTDQTTVLLMIRNVVLNMLTGTGPQ